MSLARTASPTVEWTAARPLHGCSALRRYAALVPRLNVYKPDAA